jgi:hypothetical protein
MKLLLGTFAVVVLAGVLFAPAAEARCWLNSHGWQCPHPVQHHQARKFPAPWLGY